MLCLILKKARYIVVAKPVRSPEDVTGINENPGVSVMCSFADQDPDLHLSAFTSSSGSGSRYVHILVRKAEIYDNWLRLREKFSF
jgi:hypothetical protein